MMLAERASKTIEVAFPRAKSERGRLYRPTGSDEPIGQYSRKLTAHHRGALAIQTIQRGIRMARRTKPIGMEKWTWAEINRGQRWTGLERKWRKTGREFG
jgi:hypothetical protein